MHRRAQPRPAGRRWRGRTERWIAQLAIALLALTASSGLAANPLRAEEESPRAESTTPPIVETTVVEAPPPEAGDADLKLPPSRPTHVEIDIEVVEVSQIQDHDQKFDVEFNAYFVWKDPRLAFDAQQAGATKKILPADSLWTPDPLLIDELDVDARGGATAHVQPDGTVFLNRYYRGTITGTFDLREFPLDKHGLEVALEATGYEADEVVFDVGEVRAVNDQHVVPHGWKLLDMSAVTGESRYARTNETFSLLRMTIQVARDPHFYFWSIILPLIPIMATAWSVFWMDPKEFSSQVGVGITAMLTVVAYRITIDSSLPPLTYMTRMDYFLLVCQTFVFLAFVATVAIHVLYALDVPHMRARAARLTEVCRWLPPVVLVAINVALAVLPVRYGTLIILTPLIATALWLRLPVHRFPRWIKILLKPETLLEAGAAAPPSDTPAPHRRFRGEARESETTSGERRSA
jgi:Neurotransmitter-gated ion-channel ligand binding domain/Neurotransmitter-gated ion-channel transmembrane region